MWGRGVGGGAGRANKWRRAERATLRFARLRRLLTDSFNVGSAASAAMRSNRNACSRYRQSSSQWPDLGNGSFKPSAALDATLDRIRQIAFLRDALMRLIAALDPVDGIVCVPI